MKIVRIVSYMLVSLSAGLALADVPPISPGSKAEAMANVANEIISVTKLKARDLSYQVVSMVDSAYNSDANVSTIVLVGEKGVGGAAGYESAFALSPTEELRSLKSARLVQRELELTFYDQDGLLVTRIAHYFPRSKTLIESSAVFKPSHLVSSNGKAYTECLEAREQSQLFKRREICVNGSGDYYYLAN